jgi:protein CpxP
MSQPKNKILVIIIVALLVINIGMIIFIAKMHQPSGGFHNDVKAAMPAFLQNEIGFSSEQMKQYDSINTVNCTTFNSLMDDLRKSRQQEFRAFASSGFNDSTIDSIALLSTQNKKNLETHLLQFAKAVRNICTPEQQPKFDSLLYKVLDKKNK